MIGGSAPRGASGTPATDRGLVRRVRRNLVAWSGGITLVILLVLGSAVYLGVGSSLRATSEALLRERAAQLAIAATIAPDRPPDPSRPGGLPLGIIFGGRASGTLAILVTPDGSVVGGPPGFTSPPDPGGVALARSSSAEVIRELQYGDVPIRVLSRAVTIPAGTYVVQVAADRGGEERTLGQLALVLLLGGLGAIALAVGGGWFYASRALHPIRDSLRRQREFAADASHELRTPLAVARAGMDHVARHPEARISDLSETVADVRSGLDHMTDLVDTLLLLARTDSDSIELEHVEVDLADLAATALGGLGPLAAERGARLHLDATPVEMAGDPLRLRQLVTILADNAIRHGRRDGNVWVRVGRSSEPGETAAPGTARTSAAGAATAAAGAAPATIAGTAELVVEDDGPGIAPADRTAVFGRFWRGAGASAGGSGLGLSIAAWIADRHHATIEVGERIGGGARFRVRFLLKAAPGR